MLLSIGILQRIHSGIRMREDNTRTIKKEKSLFMATLSHELRTPLSMLIGILELLKQSSCLPNRQQSLLETAHHTAINLLSLTNDLLDCASLEAGKMTLSLQSIDLRTVINDAVNLFVFAASEAHLVLHCTIDNNVGTAHQADPVRLRQIIHNLIGNALKFTTTGTINVSLKAIATTHETQLLQLTVRDTGAGIARDDIARLFGPFIQGESTSDAPPAGTGLGLFIARSIARMMGGDITLHSEPGNGTTVTMQLPLPVSRTPVVPHEEKHTLLPANTLFGLAHILIIDDHQPNRLVLQEQLRHFGCRVVDMCNAVDALAQCDVQQFDLIFCDCNMPVIDGYEFTRYIRSGKHGRLNHHTPILGYTACTTQRDNHRALLAGMQQCLVKPLDIPQLQRILLQFISDNPAASLIEDSNRTCCQHTKTGACFDPQKLHTLTMNNKEHERMLLESLVSTNTRDMQDLRHAVDGKNWQRVAAQAHRIKGAADLVGAEELCHICLHIEHSYRSCNTVKETDIALLYHWFDYTQQQLQLLLDESNAIASPPPIRQ
jgi:two-component system sensor histidine kinase EvgS